MKPEQVKIGESYRLIPQKEAEELDDRYKEFGHDNRTGAGFTDYKELQPTDIVKISFVMKSDPAKFKAIFPSGEDWWVSAEWLIPNEPEAPKRPKSCIRLIRR